MFYLYTYYFSVNFPHGARGNVVGKINNKDLGVGYINASISRSRLGTQITATLVDIPRDTGMWSRYLLMSCISFLYVYIAFFTKLNLNL